MTRVDPKQRSWALKIGIPFAGIVVIAIAAGIATSLWHQHTLPSRIEGALPGTVDLDGATPELSARLTAGREQALEGPDRLSGVEELARLYHANGYFKEAARCWNLLAAEQPQQGRWTYYLADIATIIGNTGESERLLRATVELVPDYAPAWLKLGDLDFKIGNPDTARHAYEQRLSLKPEDPYARLGLARLSLNEGDRGTAQELLGRIVGRSPRFSAAHNLLAEILAANGDTVGVAQHRWAGREAGRFRKAEDPWLDELHNWCYDPGKLQTLGTMADQTGQPVLAIGLLERATRLAPGDPYGYAILGDALLGQGKPEAAREVLERGLALGSHTKPTAGHYVVLAEAYRELQRPEEAIRLIREGMGRIGESYELYDALGVALGQTGRFEEAVGAFSAALLEKPGDSVANYNMANALLNLGREDEAVFHLKQSLILQPTYPKSLYMLARYEFERGDLAATERYLRPLYLSHPEQDEVRKLMTAWLLRTIRGAENAGDKTKVEELYREGLEVDPQSAEFTIGLGTLLLIAGQVDEATSLLERYHRLVPDDPQGGLFLGQAYARTGRFPEARTILEQSARAADAQGNARTAAFCREILGQLPGGR